MDQTLLTLIEIILAIVAAGLFISLVLPFLIVVLVDVVIVIAGFLLGVFMVLARIYDWTDRKICNGTDSIERWKKARK